MRRRIRSAFGWRWFHGDYSTWAEARRASSGYDSAAIVERVLAATLAVQRGEAAFERDGVTFADAEDDTPLLRALQTVTNASGGKLRVLDFGGALGSTYWRHRTWLDSIPDLVWDVVEQPVFVTAGREHLAHTGLRFFASVDEADREQTYDVLLVSCVVQYLEHPAAAIDSWLRLDLPWLLLNNTPLHDDGPDRLTVQHVPPNIYPASYPVWFFNREKFLAAFEGRYETFLTFDSEAVWPMGWRLYRSTGLLLRRNSPA
jgi:putative methyltransferase (TIGR04325 family)